MKRPALFAIAVLLCTSTAAAGDEDERRLGVAAGASLVELDAFDTSGQTEAGQIAVSFSWGVTDWLDVGPDLRYGLRPNLVLPRARVGGGGGDGFELYANLHTVELAAHARFLLDVGPFVKVQPLLAIRAGGALRLLTNPELFAPDGSLAARASGTTSWSPTVGGELGVVWRASQGMRLGALATASVAADQRTLGVHLEVSWFSYEWF